jgi:hypothetical protein
MLLLKIWIGTSSVSRPAMLQWRCSTTRSSVSVPVLSVQSKSIAPKFWMELRRLTITFFRLMAIAPLARQTETIIGNISGVSPTATASAKKKALFPIVFGESVDKEDKRHHDGHELEHQPSEAVDALVETGRRRVPGDGVGHTPEVGVDSRGDYDCRRRPALNARAHEAGVLEFRRRVRRLRVCILKFLDGKRLSRQRSLADE